MISDSTLIAVNVTLDAYSFITVAIILIYLLVRHFEQVHNSRWLYFTFISFLLNMLSDIFTWVCLGTARSWYPLVLKISEFVYYFTSYFLMCSFFFYLLDFICENERIRSISRHFFWGSLIVYSVILISTPFSGWLYTIDEANRYERGPLFFVPVTFQIIMYLNVVFCVIRYRKWINFRNTYSLLLFIIFPQLMQLIQLNAYGISLIGMGYTISFIVIYFDMNLKLGRELNKTFNEVRERDAKLIQVQEHTILSLSSLVEERDTDTGGHVQRTSEYVEKIARLLLEKGLYPEVLDEQYIAYLKKAAPMHDIGKIVVPDDVLKKPGRLTPDEFEQMKRHTTEGKRIIREVLDSSYQDENSYRITGEVATYHHERWGGSGYPNGLEGEEIPLSARIMALADVFDALVSPRVYKKPMSYEEAFKIIQEGAGTQFDPTIASVFLENRDMFRAINEAYINSSEVIG